MKFSPLFERSLLALGTLATMTMASPLVTRQGENETRAAASDWWFGNIERTGKIPFGTNDNYPVFRNVKDFGARGDGQTDDTVAINKAILAGGGRCGENCKSSTTTPALIFFPPGTYMVSGAIQAYYYTHIVGDLNDVPTIKATSGFDGAAVIDANPYGSNGYSWFQNQNNFFRQVRNLKIDIRSMSKSKGTCLHWQVAQATSLQNIEFLMVEDSSTDNKQQGIFMENGSGGFMTDLVFHGGRYGASLGSQQFTARNLEFNNCQTGVLMIWNWIWNFHGIKVNNCRVGIDLTTGGSGSSQSVGSTIVQDATFSNTAVGITTTYDRDQKGTFGTLIVDNCEFVNTPVAIKDSSSGNSVVDGNKKIASFVQGRSYTGTQGQVVQAERPAPSKPAGLLDSNGHIFTRSKPQYSNVPASKFVSVKTHGAKGDGKADDTAALQATFNAAAADEVVFFPHGAYLIHDTVDIPANIRITGEIWPLLMAAGNSNFQDQRNPKPMLRVGRAGDVGNVEISDIMLETKGPQPGAILLEWNVEAASAGSAGLWDVHMRVGGSAGTELQSDKCTKTPAVTTTPNPECLGAWMLMHVTKSASIYMENTWLWVADHELDRPDENQINIYNGRGLFMESNKPSWLWGTASEHSILYNYHLQDAANVYMTVIQTETAYYQSNPDAKVPFESLPEWHDPDWTKCTSKTCAKTWGLRVHDSKDILLYGGGLYSFFDNYNQDCLATESCQENMVDFTNSPDIVVYGVNTKASTNVITLNGSGAVKHLPDNVNTFCAAIAQFKAS